MVHRAPDSRLLTNLVANEKEYVRHLAGLLPLSHAALASLSAYAATSPAHLSSPAQTIAAVVDVLAGAEDALQRYAQAVDGWRIQLASLKDLEDDLTAVLRDRDILVTRLIKASKSTHRSSRLITPLSGLGSPSLSSLPSSSSITTGTSVGPASTNSKLAQAQAELQACETHLVTKERELDARRISIAREGLGARCRALIDCSWVWGEMGKQGLKALQALSANGDLTHTNGHLGSKLLPAPPAIPPHLSTNPTTYASDNSSLTPSQSASQTATRSAETTSHEHLTRTTPVLDAALENASKPLSSTTRASRTEGDGDLTITLPPAHAISDLAFPTGARTPTPKNDEPTVSQRQGGSEDPNPSHAPATRRKRTKPSPRRPPSHHIAEVSDEGSDGPSATSKSNAGVTASSRVPRAPFPTTLPDPETQDNESSSDDVHPIGPFEVVENDPFEMIRRSMLSPSVSALFESPTPVPVVSSTPSARASAPDVRVGAETSPFKTTAVAPSSGPGLGPTPAKRERRTSMAFFGSLRGLFRKPKERAQISTDWDERRSHSPSSPSTTSPNRARTRANGRSGSGWVTRTDTRIKGSRGGRGEENSDEEPAEKDKNRNRNKATPTTPIATSSPVARSGSRLRKGRPGAPTRATQENVSPRAGASVDGWVTDSGPADVGANLGAGRGGGTTTTTGTEVGRSRTRRGTIRRKKTSVADLRGSDQGHTDGEVADRGVGGGHAPSLERASSKRGKASEVSASAPGGPKREANGDVEEKAEGEGSRKERARKGSISKGISAGNEDAHANANGGPGNQHRRATTTAASSRKSLSNGHAPSMHRRSASLSLVGPLAAPLSQSQPLATPRSETPSPSPSRSPSPSQRQAQTLTDSPAKQTPRRQLSSGHTHAQSPSLMSIVVGVARRGDGEVMDKSRSLDMARTLGDVERGREASGVERETGQNGRSHARSSSSPMTGGGQAQRAIKMPLRSALRNASRTPSPSPVSMSVTGVPTVSRVVPVANGKTQEQGGQVDEDEDRGDRRIVSPRDSLRDSASISSYETTRDTFYVEEPDGVPSSVSPPRSQSGSPAPTAPSQSDDPPSRPFSFSFPPPPVDPPPVVSVAARDEMTHAADQPPSSNVSTETPPPVRRKSVRVSLPPTFSPTPPALCDEDGEGYAPWSESFSTRDEGDRARDREEATERGRAREGRQTKSRSKSGESGGTQEDMWVDSSEEDEVYSRARRLLNLVGKQDKEGGKGKGKAKA